MPRDTPVPPWVPDDLPRSPGVYAFADESGRPLYVGKSVDVRRRVRGYFYSGGPDDARLAEMLRIARRVQVQPTGSDLEARLEEADRILHDRPPYNRALKRRWRGWYLELRWREPFPRLRVVRRPRRPDSRCFGPFRGRSVPERVGRLVEKIFRLRSCGGAIRPDPGATPCIQHDLRLCTAPCARRTGLDGYRVQVRHAVRLLADASYARELRERCEGARDAAAARLEFEDAAGYQARLEWLEELETYRVALDGDGRDRSWLIVLPGAGGEERVLQPVALGRVLRRRRVAWRDGEWERAVEDVCYAVRVAELRAPSVLSPADSVPNLMVARWLEEGSPGGVAVDLTDLDASRAVARLRDLPRA